MKKLKKEFAKIILLLFLITGIFNIQNLALAQNVVEDLNNSAEKQNYMIKYNDASKKNELREKITQKNGRIKKDFIRFNTFSVQLAPDEITNIKNDPNIDIIEQDYFVQTLGEETPWGVEKIKAVEAHRQGIVGQGINIAVFDTGISQHPEIEIGGGVSFVDGVGTYNDDNGHGTNVAGVISSQINNEGIIGAAPEVNLYAVKVINSQGIGRYSDIIEGIEWAIDHNIDIINMSFGGDRYSEILEEAVNMAYENNILIFAASGNNGGENSTTYPAKYQNVIAVGAVDKENNLTGFTSTGTEMELVAPGIEIVTTSLDSKYVTVEGTSFSVPYAAGAAALLWSKDKTVLNTTIRGLLDYSALGLGDDRGLYGNGLVDVGYALEVYVDYVSMQKDKKKWKDKIRPKKYDQEWKNKNKNNVKDIDGTVEILHGDDFSTATTITVNTDISGSIDPAGDVDFFQFTTTKSGIYHIYTKGSTDTYGYLYDGGQVQVDADDDSGIDTNFSITLNLLEGRLYYIQVRFPGSSGTGAYTLRVDTPDDHGNDFSSATQIQVGTNIPGFIDPAGDVDFFKFTAPSSGTYQIYTTGSIDTYGYIYNSSQSQLEYDDDDGEAYNFSITRSLTTGQQYYIKVRHYNSSGTGSYTLRVDAPGDNFSLAIPIQVNINVSDAINYAGDVDFFQFTVKTSGKYIIFTTGSTDTYGYLYNSSQSQMAYNDDSGDLNFKIVQSLTAGQLYYIKVRHYSPSGTGSYVLLADGPDDHGGSFGSATSIQAGTNMLGVIDYSTDVDYFKFTVPTSGTYQICTTGSTNTYGYLYSNTQSLLEYNDDDGEGYNFSITRSLTTGELYYVKVRHCDIRGTGPYTLRVAASIVKSIFDNNNRLDYMELPSGTVIDYQYDANGNLIGR